MVDPGQDAAAPLSALLDEHGLTPTAVLLTHGHLDHIAAAAEVCRAADVPALIAAPDEHLLADPMAGLSDELRQALAGFPWTVCAPTRCCCCRSGSSWPD